MRVTARPILFSSEMVRALLVGRKTMTRRVVKRNAAGRAELKGRNWHIDDPDAVKACPHGQPGDLLWVRETWATAAELDDRAPRNIISHNVPVWYLAGGKSYITNGGKIGKTRVSIHMPRWASRLTLEIEEVRVERVQDISECDADAEGVECSNAKFCIEPYRNYLEGRNFSTAVRSFESLWDSINAKRGYGWDANPWIWAIRFKVHRMNVDDFIQQSQTAGE